MIDEKSKKEKEGMRRFAEKKNKEVRDLKEQQKTALSTIEEVTICSASLNR